MIDSNQQHAAVVSSRPPGTILLEDLQGTSCHLNLHPVPMEDPNDPLNWPKWRKALNYGLVCNYVLWTFIALCVSYPAWGIMMTELGYSADQLNNATALNYAALGLGCIFFIPLVHKYGRRSVYIFSVTLQFISAVWQARQQTVGDLMGTNFIAGLGGAISETIVQVSIADIFFVHQRATMNGYYLVCSLAGDFLGPAVAGYVVQSQGWRWTWWWCTIFLGITMMVVIFCFEESKYVPVFVGAHSTSPVVKEIVAEKNQKEAATKDTTEEVNAEAGHPLQIKPKTYTQRMALITKTDSPVLRHFYQPFVVLVFFPAVLYTALTYGSLIAWISVMNSIQATIMILPPYNLSSVGVGLIQLAPFVGSIIGFFVAGPLNDRLCIWLAKRNNGIFEPEFRLWLSFVATITVPGGMLIFGVGMAHGAHWMVPVIGYGIVGFGFIIGGDIALSYCTDCYQDIIADALVGIVLVRNSFAVIVMFGLTPWLNAMGAQNVHIIAACISFAIMLLPVPLLLWGKKARAWTAKRYREMALKQPTQRTF